MVGHPADSAPPADRQARRPRVAFLAYWTTEHDSRLERMAATALAAGHEVVVYGRLMPGLAHAEERDGYRIVRVRARPRLAPLLGDGAPGHARHRSGQARPGPDGEPPAKGSPVTPGVPAPAVPARGPAVPTTGARMAARVAGGPLERPFVVARWWWRRLRGLAAPRARLGNRTLAPRRWTWFLELISGWAVALDEVAEPSDIWHALGVGGLPAAIRQRRRLGGRAIYDSRDVFLQARSMARAAPLRRLVFASYERRLARRADAVLTVNDAAADLLVRQLGVPRPTVVMNVPPLPEAEMPRDDRIREALGIPRTTAVVLYQGAMHTERGIEQGIRAILDVPDAVFVVLGYGELAGLVEAAAANAPTAGRVFHLPAVPPRDLLAWTAAADVMLIAIQPTTPNHLLATPNKLFEAMAAAVPVVASDLPGLAGIIRPAACGRLVDPTSPTAIATAIRDLLALPEEERRAMGRRGRAAVQGPLAWSVQAGRLLDVYRLPVPGTSGPPPVAPGRPAP